MTDMDDYLQGGGDFGDADDYDDETGDLFGSLLSNIPIIGPAIAGITGGGAAKPSDGSGGGGGIGGLLGNIPLIGGALSGAAGSIPGLGGATGGGGPLGMISGLLPGLPLPPLPPLPPGISLPAPLVGLLGQGINQATGLAAAPTTGGSILGAGLGGLPFGTGPLPGPLGDMMSRAFGTPGLPPMYTMPPSEMQPWTDAAGHTEKVGRAIIARLMGAAGPRLDEIRRWMRQRSAQIQATGEHNALMNNQDFKAAVIEHLMQIRNAVGRPLGSPVLAAPTLYAPGVSAPGSFISKY